MPGREREGGQACYVCSAWEEDTKRRIKRKGRETGREEEARNIQVEKGGLSHKHTHTHTHGQQRKRVSCSRRGKRRGEERGKKQGQREEEEKGEDSSTPFFRSPYPDNGCTNQKKYIVHLM